ncbi:hypothetical protein [Pseudanabaena sp. UWO310]|uniref:hypothetical protein n=1 Tax=Pseudanabaena sp. UWO310 TaxID=2480795 RepID=UPI001680F531|nr:hypothetical protein [Pseudanabaena sp. UWO310]
MVWINDDDYYPKIPNLGEVRNIRLRRTLGERKYWCIDNKEDIAQILDFLKEQSKEKWKRFPDDRQFVTGDYPYWAVFEGSLHSIGYGSGKLRINEYGMKNDVFKDSGYKSISKQDEERLLELTRVIGDKKYKLIDPNSNSGIGCS